MTNGGFSKYYIWLDRGRYTITKAPPIEGDFTVTYQSDLVVKNWQSSLDWYEQVQAILHDLYRQG